MVQFKSIINCQLLRSDVESKFVCTTFSKCKIQGPKRGVILSVVTVPVSVSGLFKLDRRIKPYVYIKNKELLFFSNNDGL